MEFYEYMAIELNKQTNCPVIGISHTGHHFNFDHAASTTRHHQRRRQHRWNHRINVVEQINHKVQFLEKHLFLDEDLTAMNYDENNTDIVFIGHSIGCFIILEILEALNKNMKNQVRKAILLFPTIERMSVTPNGKRLTFLTTFFMWLLNFFALLASLLPDSIRKMGINIGFTRPHSSKQLVTNANETVDEMLKSFSCMRSCLFMGKNEMNFVKNPNTNAIERHLDLLLFYYGKTDNWCPIDYYYDMEGFLSKLNIENKKQHLVLDEHGMDHAFCLYRDQCSQISNMIQRWID